MLSGRKPCKNTEFLFLRLILADTESPPSPSEGLSYLRAGSLGRPFGTLRLCALSFPRFQAVHRFSDVYGLEVCVVCGQRQSLMLDLDTIHAALLAWDSV